MTFSDAARQEIDELLSRYPTRKAAMLPVLFIAQRENDGYLDLEALQAVADVLERPLAEVQGVATYYSMYEHHPVGTHLIEVCTNLTCMMVGGYDILDAFERRLGIRAGETTPDGRFTLKEVECLDECGKAPTMMCYNRYYCHLAVEDVDKIVDELSARTEREPFHFPGAPHNVCTKEWNEQYRDWEGTGGIAAEAARAEQKGP